MSGHLPSPRADPDAGAGADAAAGSKGNKTEQSAPLLFSVLLSLPMIVFFVYYLQFQTYV
jgi:hypothetical protein